MISFASSLSKYYAETTQWVWLLEYRWMWISSENEFTTAEQEKFCYAFEDQRPTFYQLD